MGKGVSRAEGPERAARPALLACHLARDDSVAFPTNDGTKLHAALDWPWVAFEVDGVEPGGGRSVGVVGQAEEVVDTEAVERLAGQRRVLWAGDKAKRWIRIAPTKITGRRIWADEV